LVNPVTDTEKRANADSSRALTRRGVLSGVTASCLTVGCMAVPPIQMNPSIEHYPTIPRGKSLAGLAETKGIKFGSAAAFEHIFDDRAYRSALEKDCAVVVPENEMKWRELQPKPGYFDWRKADLLVEYCEDVSLLCRGHTLLWQEGTPKWVRRKEYSQSTAELLTTHISTVVSRYKGRIFSWDVVNEALGDEDGKGGGLRETFWSQELGLDHVDLAFRTAAEADPNAILTYNENQLTGSDQQTAEKRSALISLVEGMQGRGVPIHAVGIQSHLSSCNSFDEDTYARFLGDIADLGLQIFLTELDVSDRCFPSEYAVRDENVASLVEAVLTVALENSATKLITTWGLSDRYNWWNDVLDRHDGLPMRSHVYDEAMLRKPVWQSIAGALERAPARAPLEMPRAVSG